MFDEQTNGLVSRALAARERALTEQQGMQQRQQARAAAAAEETQAAQGYQSAQKELNDARAEALRAVTAALSLPPDQQGGQQAPANANRQGAPRIAGLR